MSSSEFISKLDENLTRLFSCQQLPLHAYGTSVAQELMLVF